MESINLEGSPEKEPDQVRAIAEGCVEGLMRELHALFPSKLGESSTDLTKEGYREREDEEVVARFCEFMKRGSCKESFTAMEDCVNETDSIVKCAKHFPILIKCVDAHSKYYQPIIAMGESAMEKMGKEVIALVEEEEDD